MFALLVGATTGAMKITWPGMEVIAMLTVPALSDVGLQRTRCQTGAGEGEKRGAG
jgi:hypothetical protein